MKFIRVLKANEEKWAVYLRGEKISPAFNSKEEAIKWAEERYSIDNDDIRIDKDLD